MSIHKLISRILLNGHHFPRFEIGSYADAPHRNVTAS